MGGPLNRDRRRAVRRLPSSDEPLSRVRLRAGRDLHVIDVSDTGALVEGTSRLLPGTHVDVHLVTHEGRLLVRSHVVRAFVSHVEADLVRYRGALAFERHIDTSAVGYAIPDALSDMSGDAGMAYPQTRVTPCVEGVERLSA